MKRNHIASLALVLSILLAAASCASSRSSGFEDPTAASASGSKEGAGELADAKRLWAKRDNKAELEKAVTKLEGFVKIQPQNYEALVLLCRANYLLADGHTDDKEMKKKIWEKGTYWGEKALATNPAVRKKVVDEKGNIEDVVDQLGKEQIEAIYWTAVNLGKWAKLAGIGSSLKYKGRIVKMIEQVEKLDPKFFYGAVHRYWGTYFAALPGFAGGDMDKSLKQYTTGMESYPQYLGTGVLLAENYAVKKNERQLFVKTLNDVIAADPAKVAEITPENRIEQAKAKKLLAQEKELFD